MRIGALKEGDLILATDEQGTLTTDSVSVLSVAEPEAEAERGEIEHTEVYSQHDKFAEERALFNASAFQAADVDRDGRLNKKEFAAFLELNATMRRRRKLDFGGEQAPALALSQQQMADSEGGAAPMTLPPSEAEARAVDEDDQELLEHLATLGASVELVDEVGLRAQPAAPDAMLFADSSVVQQLLPHSILWD